jgi:hypothetical protein
MTDHFKYEVKLYELENGRWNYYVYVSMLVGDRWGGNTQIGNGSTDTEDQAIKIAQEQARLNRGSREKTLEATKIVALL